MVSEAMPNTPPIRATPLFTAINPTATAANTTRAGTARPTKQTS